VEAADISGRIEDVRRRIDAACQQAGRQSAEVTLIAISKGFPADAVRRAAAAGIRHFGENRVQEAQVKMPDLTALPGDVTWHMVGHLQTNKVKLAIMLFDIIHSVDSLPLAEAISRRASSHQPVFLEVNVSNEPTKYGFSLDDLPERFGVISELPNIEVRGLMTVAPQSGSPEVVRPVFQRLREAAYALNLEGLSMGMSDDFGIAIEEGATHVRLGRAIFGER
jgi:pyridoxal phosphate enzyme (YggS family)